MLFFVALLLLLLCPLSCHGLLKSGNITVFCTFLPLCLGSQNPKENGGWPSWLRGPMGSPQPAIEWAVEPISFAVGSLESTPWFMDLWIYGFKFSNSDRPFQFFPCLSSSRSISRWSFQASATTQHANPLQPTLSEHNTLHTSKFTCLHLAP